MKRNRRSRQDWMMDSDNRFRRRGSAQSARRLYEGLRMCRRLGIDCDGATGFGESR